MNEPKRKLKMMHRSQADFFKYVLEHPEDFDQTPTLQEAKDFFMDIELQSQLANIEKGDQTGLNDQEVGVIATTQAGERISLVLLKKEVEKILS